MVCNSVIEIDVGSSIVGLLVFYEAGVKISCTCEYFVKKLKRESEINFKVFGN